jgi:protein tyrosine phosphatase (PTP) superfamily phosphohydrolase (DUF442 family)
MDGPLLSDALISSRCYYHSMLADIINYLEIDPRLGTAGQPDPDEFGDIQAAGYELVINLLPASSPDAIPEEPALVAGLGMEYLSIPVIWQQPTHENLSKFFADLHANRGRKVFVHCAMNMRVSAFVFLYRALVEGVPVATARETMQKIWEPNPVWQAFIEAELQRTSPI